MRLTCVRMELLSAASLAGRATVAERLELEAHLETCLACRHEHGLLGAARSIRDWQAPGLTEAARDRVRQAALHVAGRGAVVPLRARRRWPSLVGAGALVVAAAFAVVVLLRAPGDRIVAGDIELVGLEGPRIPEGATMHAARGGRALLGNVSLELAGDTQVVWRAAAQAVELARGQVTVDVTPGKGRHFRVITPRFVVEVVGTRFVVNLAGVSTERGTVHVKGPDGGLLAILTAGQRWQVDATPSSPTNVRPERPSASMPAAPVSPAPLAFVPVSKATTAPSPADRLLRARRALTQGNAEQARALLVPLYRGPRNIAVEARAIAAESYLVEGRYGDAIESYGVVVQDFQGTAQAESALYAIAQLQIEASRRDEAAQTLRRYLSRYPDGRFVKEARERLNKLASRPIR